MTRTIVLMALAAGLLATGGCQTYQERESRVARIDDYVRAAARAQQRGEWATAQEFLTSAVGQTAETSVDPHKLAVVWYEFGRSSGAVCKWADAERGLAKALELDRRNGGPVHMDLFETARLHQAMGDHARAAAAFADASAAMDAVDAETRDVIGYAAFLEDMATSLDAVGRTDEAARHRARAAELRRAFPGVESNTDLTPYGEHCAAG